MNVEAQASEFPVGKAAAQATQERDAVNPERTPVTSDLKRNVKQPELLLAV